MTLDISYWIQFLSASTLKCYSGKDDKLEQLTCSQQSSRMCLKKVYDSGEIQRGCAFTSELKALRISSDTCKSFPGGEDCFCSEELCNSGPMFKESSIIWLCICLIVTITYIMHNFWCIS